MKKRKVGNLMALGVLSAVAYRDMHPYEMAGTLRSWGKDRDLGIKWGSLYTVVRNLARHGLIEEVGSVRDGRRPERTVYRITDAGRAELVDWTRELVSTGEPFRAGLSMLSALPPDDAVALLQQRADAIGERIEELRAQLEAETTPRLFLVEVEYDLAMLTAEAAWTRALIAEITAGTFAGLDEWREYHR
ncbi:PadR family transcriptional regulator [Actinoplanes sp. Pm04-4]|uniref:PadR family transcriptional regulator n=1 Tax=Paractinoplanes pyxinae TaxID=2997416 RepID=A0ABT4B6T0_9ACTN|nr:PadR family transcriptional regulator [Actinoplanes pyxinae]MCY1142186.1 PadR family transcriptional regulator [Actinoplanes pyxinae]